MSTPEEVAQALDNAADYIEVNGWCQGSLREPDGRVCLYGALIRANLSEVKSPLIAQAFDAVQSHLGCHPVLFNDADGRTEYEVIDELRHAAKDLRNEVGP